jgi:hypothetical protein
LGEENGQAVLVAVLAGSDDPAEIGVEDAAGDQGQHYVGERAAIVAGDMSQLGDVEGLVVLHLRSDAGEVTHFGSTFSHSGKGRRD